MRRLRKGALGAALLALAVLAAACGGDDEPGGGATTEPKGTIIAGASSTFPENQIVAEMYAQVLENAGYTVERQLGLETREISQPALVSGQIDVKPEYIGTLLKFLDPEAETSSDVQAIVDQLGPLLETDGISLLEPSAANDTNAFVVTGETAEQHGLATVSDLAPVAGELTLGGPEECPDRPFCIPGLKDTYGVEFGEFEVIGACDSATAEALEAGRIDVALLCSTQAVISANGWVVLEDDKGLQPADNIAPVIRTDVLNDEIEQLLNAVSAALTTEKIVELNAQVEIEREDPEDVARAFLESEGLL